MNELTVKSVRGFGETWRSVMALMKTSFPREELVPLSLLQVMTLRKGVSFLAFYDAETFVGTTYLVEFRSFLFVFYLAVSPSVRGKGYGSRILEWIKSRSEGKNIAIDVEALGNGDNIMKLRRIEFYRREGITDTGYRLMDNGVKYMILSSSPDTFSPDIFEEGWRSFLFGCFTEHLFREN